MLNPGEYIGPTHPDYEEYCYYEMKYPRKPKPEPEPDPFPLPFGEE